MISRIFRFSQAEARKAMVPLVGVDAVPEETSLAAAIETVRREGFSRIPVYGKGIDDIVGIAYVKDLMRAEREDRAAAPVTEVMRPAQFVPDSKRIAEMVKKLDTK